MNGFLLSIIAGALLAGGLQAEDAAVPSPPDEATVVEFTVQEEPPRHPEKKWALVPAAGIGFPDMDEINDYADWINDSFGGSVDDVDLYEQYGLALEYRLQENWHLGLAYHRLEAGTDGSYPWMGGRRNVSIDLNVDGAELYLRRSWPRMLGPLDVAALLGAGYYRSHYREVEDGYHVSGADDQLGLRAGVGLGWEISDSLGLSLEGDYRLLEFDSYKDSGRTVRFVSPGNPRAEADFSGFSLWARLSWRF